MHHRAPDYYGRHHPAELQAHRRLISVTVQGRVGPVQVIMSPENTVEHLIKTVLQVYKKERRRPLLNENHPSCFQLHNSPFSLQSLKEEEELINLGSRNFYLCHKPIGESYSRTCFDQSKKINKFPFQWPKLMELLLYVCEL